MLAETAKELYKKVLEAEQSLKSAKIVYESFNDSYAAIVTKEEIQYADGSTHRFKKTAEIFNQ